MFLLTQTRRKGTVDVNIVMNQIQDITGANPATPLVSEKSLINGHQATQKLIILFKTLKHMRGHVGWY